MVFTSVARYHGRINTAVTPNRKEWRRVGRPTLVVTGGTVSGPLVVTLAASPNPANPGDSITLTATTTGGNPPYTRTFTQVSGAPVTLAGTGGTTRTFVATAASGSRVFRVSARDDEGNTQEATVSVDMVGAPVGQPLYAGHIPNRVLVGVAGPEADVPDWDASRTLIRNASQAQLGYQGAGAYEHRRFTGTQCTGSAANANELRDMLADGDADGVYNWVSFKVTGNDWSGVAAGNYPAIPQMFRTVALERKAAGKAPFMATLHHEPRGDGSLANWSAMQIYMSNALVDVNDSLAWSCIGNGFLWNNVTGSASVQAERVDTFPQSLINTFRTNKHVVAVDTYDDHPAYTGQTAYPVGGQTNRCSQKLANWITWMRARNCGALGIGEWSVTDVAEMSKVWKVQRENRDILGIVNYFNSIAGGSTWDWRLVPNGFPTDPGNPGVDYGGTPLTGGRLNYFPTMIAESISAQYTSPL